MTLERHGVALVRAANPGPFTLSGTNTWLVGRDPCWIVDPGPALPEHIDALMEALKGETVTHLLISHTHLDHTASVPVVKQRTGAPTYGFGPHQSREGTGGDLDFVPDQTVRDGETIQGRDWQLTALHTPGHAGNHLCFALAQEDALFSADHVMGWSTSVVSPPDGDMAAYLGSLEKLRGRGDRIYWPGHGPAIPDPEPFLAALAAHREEREALVAEALARAGRPVAAAELVGPVYGPLDPRLVAAAGRSLLAHLIKLEAEGAAKREGEAWLPA